VKFFAAVFFDANDASPELKEVGALIHSETYTHQYPNCWRSKNPIISGHGAVVHLHGEKRIRQKALRPSTK